jgi:hypothetical protein
MNNRTSYGFMVEAGIASKFGRTYERRYLGKVTIAFELLGAVGSKGTSNLLQCCSSKLAAMPAPGHGELPVTSRSNSWVQLFMR